MTVKLDERGLATTGGVKSSSSSGFSTVRVAVEVTDPAGFSALTV